MKSDRYVWLDGKFIREERAVVPVTTHAIHYGTSAFEGIRAYWSSEQLYIFRLDDHLRRLRRSGQYYNMQLHFTDSQMKDAITSLCKKNNIRRSCYIRPFYFVSNHGINLHVTSRAPTVTAIMAFPLGRIFDSNGISACVVQHRKFSDSSTPTQAKMGGNYLNSIIATHEAKKDGYDEAILLDTHGNISEAPGENIFLVKNGKLYTPSVSSSALRGITRDTILKVAHHAKIPASSEKIGKRRLYSADEVFLTGTAAEITPVVQINGKKIGGGIPGKMTQMLMEQYSDMVTNRNPQYSHWLTGVYG